MTEIWMDCGEKRASGELRPGALEVNGAKEGLRRSTTKMMAESSREENRFKAWQQLYDGLKKIVA